MIFTRCLAACAIDTPPEDTFDAMVSSPGRLHATARRRYDAKNTRASRRHDALCAAITSRAADTLAAVHAGISMLMPGHAFTRNLNEMPRSLFRGVIYTLRALKMRCAMTRWCHTRSTGQQAEGISTVDFQSAAVHLFECCAYASYAICHGSSTFSYREVLKDSDTHGVSPQ